MIHQASLVWGGTIAAAGCGLAIQVLLARNFEPSKFGQIANASALSILVATFAVQGVGDVLMRQNGKAGIRSMLAATTGLGLVAMLAAFGWVASTKFEHHEVGMLLAFVPFMMI